MVCRESSHEGLVPSWELVADQHAEEIAAVGQKSPNINAWMNLRDSGEFRIESVIGIRKQLYKATGEVSKGQLQLNPKPRDFDH